MDQMTGIAIVFGMQEAPIIPTPKEVEVDKVIIKLKSTLYQGLSVVG